MSYFKTIDNGYVTGIGTGNGGTAATSNTDAYPYVFKIEGYYD